MKVISTVHCISTWNTACLTFSGWTIHYLCIKTFTLAKKCVGKTLAYNWGVNNEKDIGVILDDFLFICLPFPVYILHRPRGHYELSIPLPTCQFETKQELFKKWKWNCTQELDLSKPWLLTNQSLPENRKTNKKERSKSSSISILKKNK